MTEGNGHVIDPAGQASRALRAAVTEHGPQVLSNAVIMDGICRDHLSGLPGESILIGSAAWSDVPALLRQRAASMGIDRAIRSVAATLAEAHALDTAASVWVVSEFARALGYALPTEAPPAAGPGTAVRGQPPFGSRPPPRNALGVAAAVGLIAVYFGIAAVAHLTPFHQAASSVRIITSGQPSHPGLAQGSSADAAPSPSPDPDASAPVNSPAQVLWNLIPGGVRSSGCRIAKTYVGAIAARRCTGVSFGSGPGHAAVTYYLFADNTALYQAYADYLRAVRIQEGSGNCEDFKSYRPPCETAITNAVVHMTGRAVEFTYKGDDDLISTFEQKDVLVYITDPDGPALLKWWLYPANWIVTGI